MPVIINQAITQIFILTDYKPEEHVPDTQLGIITHKHPTRTTSCPNKDEGMAESSVEQGTINTQDASSIKIGSVTEITPLAQTTQAAQGQGFLRNNSTARDLLSGANDPKVRTATTENTSRHKSHNAVIDGKTITNRQSLQSLIGEFNTITTPPSPTTPISFSNIIDGKENDITQHLEDTATRILKDLEACERRWGLIQRGNEELLKKVQLTTDAIKQRNELQNTRRKAQKRQQQLVQEALARLHSLDEEVAVRSVCWS